MKHHITPHVKMPYKNIRLCWWIVGLFFIIFFFSYIYADLVFTYEHSLSLQDALLDGSFLGFYSNNSDYIVKNSVYHTSAIPIYDIPIYIIFAIWNIPVAIAKAYGVDVYNSTMCLLWMKTLLAFSAAIMVFLISKIAIALGVSASSRSDIYFFAATSPLIAIPILLVTQYDVLSIIFTLLGMYYYIKDNSKKFIIFFSISICFKLFALFIFVPLLLLKEKRILKVLTNCILSILPLVVFRFLLPISSSGNEVALNMIMFLLRSQIPLGNGNFICFLAAYCVFLFWCYRFQNIKRNPELIPWAALLALSLFFIFSKTHPYWIILIAPYLVICLFLSKRNRFEGIVLETIASVSYILHTVLYYEWCYNQKVVANMVWPHIFGQLDDKLLILSVSKALHGLGFSAESVSCISSMFFTFFIVALVLFIIHTYPLHKKETDVPAQSIRRATAWRAFFTICLCSIPLVMYFLALPLQNWILSR